MFPNAKTPSLPQQPRSNAERRKGQRFIPRRSLMGQIETDAGERIDAQVQNLSARGVALLLPFAFASGSILTVRLVNSAATFSLVMSVRVVHCNPLLNGDQYLGCEFDRPLVPGEMGPFLV